MMTTCTVVPLVETYCRYNNIIFNVHVHILFLGKVNLNTRLIRYYGPQKNKLSCGIQALYLLPGGNMLVGSGEGTLAMLLPSLKRGRSTKVSGAVSSIALSKDGKQVYSIFSIFTDIASVCVPYSSMWGLTALSAT